MVKNKFSKKLLSLNGIVRYSLLIILSTFTLVGCCNNFGDKKNLRDKKSNKSKTNNFQLLVNDLNCRTRVINLNKEASIFDLKNVLQDRTGLKVPEQILCYGGKLISYNNTKIGKVFKPLSLISLFKKLKGGGGNDFFKFVNFDRNNQPFKMFSSEAPKWRVVTSGINLEGRCGNTLCDAHGRMVWCDLKSKRGSKKKRFKGKIDLDEDDLDDQFINPFMVSILRTHCFCPICKEPVKHKTVTRFGFYNCAYDILGENYDTGKLVENMGNKSDRGDGFIYFDGEDMPNWSFISVVVRKL